MQILTVDIGTGTQDICLHNTRLDPENGFKLILPSPTMMVHRRIRAATQKRHTLILDGVTMGGGPCQWAAQEHIRAGLPIFATPDAARTFNDELEKVERLGIRIVSENEAQQLTRTSSSADSTTRIRLADFDLDSILQTFQHFHIPLDDLAAIAVAVFDHGNAPAGISDRQFRFDYLDERLRISNRLSTFAFLASDIPASMTRLQAVAASARSLPAPLIVMDTAPAAILGAIFDPVVAARPCKIIANIGNFHCLAFRLGQNSQVEGLFEHHTGEVTRPKLETYLRALAAGTLTHTDIFNDMGHGALVYRQTPLELDPASWQVAVTGPRRSLLTDSATAQPSSLKHYSATPFGDMMLSGNFGMLAATADLLPNLGDEIRASLGHARGIAPWDV